MALRFFTTLKRSKLAIERILLVKKVIEKEVSSL